MCSQVYKYFWKLVITDIATDQFVSFSNVEGNITLSFYKKNWYTIYFLLFVFDKYLV